MLEVITPGTQVYTTLAEFKAFYEIEDTSRDAYWQGLIDTATELVEDHVGRPLIAETVRETFYLDHCPTNLVLERWPVSAGATVKTGLNDTLLDASGYQLDVRNGLLTRLTTGSLSRWSQGKVVVDYTGGYLTAPQRLKEAVWRAVYAGDEMSRRQEGVRSERIEGLQSITFVDNKKGAWSLPPYVCSLLNKFRDGGYV